MTPEPTTPTGLESSPVLDQLLPALFAVQAELDPVAKDSQNTFHKTRYADLAAIWAACREPLARHGFLVLYPLRPTEGGTHEIACHLAHTSGQWLRSRLLIGADPKDPQKVGSAITYARRYLLASLLAITTEDDDGHAASQPARERRPAEAPRREEPAPAKSPRESYAAWVARIDRQARDYWENQLKIEKVPRDDWKPLPNQFAITNHLCKLAIKKGLWKPADVQSEGKGGEMVHDKSKARERVSGLFAKKPNRVIEIACDYLLEKEVELRAELGMSPLSDEEMAPGKPPGKGDAYDDDLAETPHRNGHG